MDNCVLIWFDTSQFLPIFSGLLIGTWVMRKACPWRHQHTDITLIFTQTHQHHFFLQGRTIRSLLSIPNKLIGLFTPLNGDQYIGIHCMHCQVSRNASCMHFNDSHSMSSIFPNPPPLVGQREFRSLIFPLSIFMILPDVVFLTTSGAASDEKLIKMTTFLFQWRYLFRNPDPTSTCLFAGSSKAQFFHHLP